MKGGLLSQSMGQAALLGLLSLWHGDQLKQTKLTEMTLLEASTTLVDAARQLPENRHLKHAIFRMEKRIEILRRRKVQQDNLRAHKRLLNFQCPLCKHAWDNFVDFRKLLVFDPAWEWLEFNCAVCGETFRPETEMLFKVNAQAFAYWCKWNQAEQAGKGNESNGTQETNGRNGNNASNEGERLLTAC